MCWVLWVLLTLSIAHELMFTFVGITWIRWPFVVLVLQKPQAGQKLPALRTSLQQTLRRSMVKTWNQHASTKQTNVHSSHTIFECVCVYQQFIGFCFSVISPFPFRLPLAILAVCCVLAGADETPAEQSGGSRCETGRRLVSNHVGGPRWKCNRMRGLTKGCGTLEGWNMMKHITQIWSNSYKSKWAVFLHPYCWACPVHQGPPVMGRILVASVPLRWGNVTRGACHSLGFWVPVGGTLAPCWLTSRPIPVAGRCVLTASCSSCFIDLIYSKPLKKCKASKVVQGFLGSSTQPCLSLREIWFSCHKGNVGRCWHDSWHCESALEEAGQCRGFSTVGSQSTTWIYGLMMFDSCLVLYCNPM